MDNNRISSAQPNQVAQSKPKSSPKASSILSFMTGAKTAVNNTVKQAQETAGKMSSALESTKNKVAQELSVPKMPKSEKPLTAEQRADVARREIIEKAQPETLSGESFDPNADVTELLKAGVNKVGTDEKAIRDLFWDRTPEQVKAIEALYNDRRPGRDMWKDLNNEFEDANDRKMMDAFRRGDRVGAASAALVDATTGSTSKKRVEAVLDRLSPEEAAQVQERYKKDHPRKQELSDWVDRKFKGDKETQMKALLNGDESAADIASMKLNLRKRNGGDVIEALRSKSPEERAEFIKNYDAQAPKGQDIESLAGRLKGTNRDQALALIEGNEAGADAALLQDAMDGMGSNKDKIWDGLGSDIEDPAARKAHLEKVEQEYNKMYGPESRRRGKSLEQRLKSELGGENEQKALSLLDDGQLSDGEKMNFALSGGDKDGEEIATLVRKLGPEKAREVYNQQTGRNLDTDVQKKLRGRDRFEASDALKGEPKTPEEMVARARERAEFENPKGAARLAGAFTDADNEMWNNVGRAEEALSTLVEARTSGDERQIALAEQRVSELTGYAQADSKLYRDEKDGAVEIAATVATTAAAVAVTVGTAGTAGPIVATGLAMTAGATANVGTRATLQGGAYDTSISNIATDAAWGAAEGIGIKGGMVAGRVAREGAEGIIKGGARTRKYTGAAVEGTIDGAVGGSIAAAGHKALEEGTWEDGILSGVGKVVTDGAIGGTVGAVAGGTLGAPVEAGIDAGAAGLRKLGIGKKSADAAPGPRADVEMDASPTAKADVETSGPSPTPSTPKEALPNTAWADGSYKNSESYTKLSPEQRAEVDDLLSKQLEAFKDNKYPYAADRKHQTGVSLVRMMESGKLWQTDSHGVSLARRLKDLRDNPRHDNLAVESQEIYESTVRMVDKPGRIHQGERGTCAAATLQYLHASTDPVDFVRVTDGLTGPTGKVKLKTDLEISANETSLDRYRVDPNTGRADAHFDGETGEPIGIDKFTGISLESSNDTLSLIRQLREKNPDASDELVVARAIELTGDLNRGPVSRIYQSTAMDHVANLHYTNSRGLSLKYDNLAHRANNDRLVTPEELEKLSPAERRRVMERKLGGFKAHSEKFGDLKGTGIEDGLSPEQQRVLRDDFLGGDTGSATIARDDKINLSRLNSNQQPELSDFSEQTLSAVNDLYRAAELANEGKPVSIGVQWGESLDSGHAVVLVGTNENGDFIIHNSQMTGQMDIAQPGQIPRDSSPDAVGLERALQGYSVIKREDLVPRLRSVTFPKEGKTQ